MVNLQYRIFTSEIDIIEWDWNRFDPDVIILIKVVCYTTWYNPWYNDTPEDKYKLQMKCVHPVIPALSASYRQWLELHLQRSHQSSSPSEYPSSDLSRYASDEYLSVFIF